MAVDKVILGEKCMFSTDSSITGINNNILVTGSSGCGKTMSISEARLLETYNSSLIITVTKRRIVEKYIPLFRQRGYKVLDLNFIDPSKSNIAFDPLAYVKNYADITFLATSIVKAGHKKENTVADPYWDDSAIALLSAEIACTMTYNSEATFADVIKMHNSIDFSENGSLVETSLDHKFERLAKKDPNCFAVTCYRTFKKSPLRTASCIFSTLNSVINNIFTPELCKMIESNKTVDFEKLGSEKTILFVSSSAVNPSLHCFINMFYAQAFKELFEFAEGLRMGELPVPVHVLCDDFATGSKIHNFAEYISIFREKGISVTLLLQSESQLETMYGTDEATTIINNCDTYIYLGSNDLRSARNVSERLNAPLDEVLWMEIGKEILFRRGHKPIVTQRYDIQKNPVYQKVTKEYNDMISDSKAI